MKGKRSRIVMPVRLGPALRGLVPLAAAALLWTAPALAQTDPDGPCAGMSKPPAVTVPTPKDAARLPDGRPVVAWVGVAPDELVAGQPVPWPAAVLARMNLAPGSVVSGIGISRESLAGWQAPGVRFIDVGFADASLAGADLAGACFDHGTVSGSDFSGATLSGVRFEGTELQSARFDGADLSGAVLSCVAGIVGEGCPGYEDQGAISLRGANLRGANVAGPVSMLDAVLEGARVEGTSLPLTATVLEGLAKAHVASVRLMPPGLRYGEGEVFSGGELRHLLQLGGGTLQGLLAEMDATPSFDCSLAGLSVVEKALCRPGDLAALDRLMAATYRRAMDGAADKALVKTAQTAFLKVRNACATVAENTRETCIAAAYTARLADLGRGFAGAVSAPGTRRFSAAPPVPKAAVAAEPVVAKLLRAYGDAPDTAQVHSARGTLTLTAEALGGNGHSCTFEGPLRFDTVRSTWVGEVDDETMAWVILPDGVVNASTVEEARYFCGMRAFWPAVYFLMP